MSPGYRGRFAPSPTGALHLGSAMAAFASWADAANAHGAWLVRIEDIDPPREVAGASIEILETLEALGLVSAEPILWQSRRSALYEEVVERLLRAGHAFECRCSRTDLHATGGIHRGACVCARRGGDAAIRLRMADATVSFEDRIQGPQQQALLHEVGDFVLRRRDGLFAYQLAVCIDDALQGITDVVRGSDLLDSTPRQIYLQRLLGLPTPRYAHIPILVDALGAKLSKQNLAPAISTAEPLDLLRQVAGLLGQHIPSGQSTLAAWLTDAAAHWRIERVPSTLALRIPIAGASTR